MGRIIEDNNIRGVNTDLIIPEENNFMTQMFTQYIGLTSKDRKNLKNTK